MRIYAVVVAIAAAGCDLYSEEPWTFCDREGFHRCVGDRCVVVGPCPIASPCSSDEQCGTGDHCVRGACARVECEHDAACPPAMTCALASKTCEPIACIAGRCREGSICGDGMDCIATCFCTNDDTAEAAGWGWCNEETQTCLPGIDTIGTCFSNPDGQYPGPSGGGCPRGTVPTVIRSQILSFTGQCRKIEHCDVPPSCSLLRHREDCEERADCAYDGTCRVAPRS